MERREIKVGDRFGRLTVIKKISEGRSLLRCDCGNTIELMDSQLRGGRHHSCGCLVYNRDIRKDITGKRYGKLVVTKELGRGYVMCHCDCGNDKKVRKWLLMQGYIHSCGCWRQDVARKKSDIKSLSKDGTNLSILASKNLRSSNTSGVRGVSWSQARMKWVGGIKIKGIEKKRRFDKFEDAVEYRKMLEELYLEPLLEQSSLVQKPSAVPDDELRNAREKACLTRQSVHDRTGLSIVSLQQWENGCQHPTLEARKLLVDWYLAGSPTLHKLGVSEDKPDGDYLLSLNAWEEKRNVGLSETSK